MNEWEHELINKLREAKRQYDMGNYSNANRYMADARAMLDDVSDIQAGDPND